jgi:hypothetical protein
MIREDHFVTMEEETEMREAYARGVAVAAEIMADIKERLQGLRSRRRGAPVRASS